MTFQDFINSTKKTFEEDPKGFVPYFFVRTNERIMMIPAATSTDEEKHMMLATVEVILALTSADEYHFVIDTWVVERDNDDDLKGKPSDQHDRREALVVMRVTRDSKQAVVSKYTRNKGTTIVWDGDAAEMDDAMVTGPYVELLPPSGLADILPPSVKEASLKAIDKFTVQKGTGLI